MTKYASRAQCRFTAFGEAVLSFPFNRALVDDLKASIPSRYRTFSNASKEWTVLPEYVDLAIALLLDYFPDAHVPLRERTWERHSESRSESWRRGTDHFAVLHLLPSAPRELIDAAYRALAKLHHPDHGGKPAVMRQLTEAHEALNRRLSA